MCFERAFKKGDSQHHGIKVFLQHSSCTKELNALQSRYHKMMNNRNHEIDGYFQFDDFGNDSERYF